MKNFYIHIGTTYHLALVKKNKQIVNLEDQIFPSPPTHNPDEQFLHIGTHSLALDQKKKLSI